MSPAVDGETGFDWLLHETDSSMDNWVCPNDRQLALRAKYVPFLVFLLCFLFTCVVKI